MKKEYIRLIFVLFCFAFSCTGGKNEKQQSIADADALENDMKSDKKPENHKQFHGDTAKAVEILSIFYERTWQFIERKGCFPFKAELVWEAIHRPYIKAPLIPELPEGWRLVYGDSLPNPPFTNGHEFICRTVTELHTARGDTFKLWLSDSCVAYKTFIANGLIKGPGVEKFIIHRDRPNREYVYVEAKQRAMFVALDARDSRDEYIVNGKPRCVDMVITDSDGDSISFNKGILECDVLMSKIFHISYYDRYFGCKGNDVDLLGPFSPRYEMKFSAGVPRRIYLIIAVTTTPATSENKHSVRLFSQEIEITPENPFLLDLIIPDSLAKAIK